MRPKLLLNLVLLVVLTALVGVAFFEPGKEEPKVVYLTEMDEGALDRFELRNQESLAFQKQGGHWWLASPFSAPANEIRMRQLLKIAKAESHARYPLKPEDLAKFELDKPKAVLTLGQIRLIFGGLEPIDMLRYVQVGDTLHLVADDFSHHLLAKATDYVDKKLLPEDGKIKEIFLPGLKASLGEKGQWNLEPPGDAAAMAELANAWQSVRAIEVTRYEQQPQGDVVRISLSDGQSPEFVILQREPDFLLVRPDWKLQYMVAAESGKRLLSLQKPTDDAGGNPEDEEGEDSQDPSIETLDPADDDSQQTEGVDGAAGRD